MVGRYRAVGETQYRFDHRLKIIRVQLTGDLTGVGEIGPKSNSVASLFRYAENLSLAPQKYTWQQLGFAGISLIQHIT